MNLWVNSILDFKILTLKEPESDMEQQLADLPGEKWVDIRFEEKYANNYYIQISNLGRIKTFTKSCKGRLINGCIQFGYRTLKLNLYVPRDPITERKFKFIGAEVVKLRLKIEKMNRQIAKNSTPESSSPEFKAELEQLEKLYKKVYQNYQEDLKADLKSRSSQVSFIIHRLVAEHFCEKPLPGQTVVYHIDHNKLNNSWNNLRWGTYQEATQHWLLGLANGDKSKIQNSARSINTKNHKLNETRVMLIKKKINSGVSLRNLSKQFKVTETQLLRIKRGINWGDVVAAE